MVKFDFGMIIWSVVLLILLLLWQSRGKRKKAKEAVKDSIIQSILIILGITISFGIDDIRKYKSEELEMTRLLEISISEIAKCKNQTENLLGMYNYHRMKNEDSLFLGNKPLFISTPEISYSMVSDDTFRRLACPSTLSLISNVKDQCDTYKNTVYNSREMSVLRKALLGLQFETELLESLFYNQLDGLIKGISCDELLEYNNILINDHIEKSNYLAKDSLIENYLDSLYYIGEYEYDALYVIDTTGTIKRYR